MKQWTEAIPYFSHAELACKGSGVVLLDIRFAVALPVLRNTWGRPLRLNSVSRSPEHNAKIKGHIRSLHLTIPFYPAAFGTLAADIDWSGWSMQDRRDFDKLARATGWSTGRALTFIHVDRRVDIGLQPTSYNYAGASADGW